MERSKKLSRSLVEGERNWVGKNLNQADREKESKAGSGAMCLWLWLFTEHLFLLSLFLLLILQLSLRYIQCTLTHSFNEFCHFQSFFFFSSLFFTAFESPELDMPPQEECDQCSGKLDLPFWLVYVSMQPHVCSAATLLTHFLYSTFWSWNLSNITFLNPILTEIKINK